MKDGICPKCGAREVHRYDKTPVEFSIALSFFNSASVVYYICAGCGYVELFVDDPSKLPQIAEKYPKV